MTYQTRSEENGLAYHGTFEQAWEAAVSDPTIWKISFTVEEERIRLVRGSGDFCSHWRYEPIKLPECVK